ncbi:helix-turn-helix domain-containing protein [Shimia thalassica]|uniref:helix-turn-helix domain-containing protein n=1 Tax=Shimia thalassica TaxID=1715693 RepID=UPI0026E34DB5|nr:helix-turn-helix transcriptional regulator [Shimia thalassica]MDO6481793.1 helix-turn-helix domain-containing protein [Shimia thalassica]
MARDTLTGSRIRERRTVAGIRQAELARDVGISASYLNLIEHNRRRIGGKLLVDIAQILGVEPSLLSEGAEAALISTLREAAADSAATKPELDRIDEFAGRFPGWAALISENHRRIAALERTAATLTDRLTHDPHLATSMHEVLTMVTAIRSTSGILAETEEIEPEWRTRFHRNLNEDSQRLAESSQRLVSYLDGAGDAGASLTSPMEEVELMLAEHNYSFPQLEEEQDQIAEFVEAQTTLKTSAAREMAAQALRQLRADARNMPREEMKAVIEANGADPAGLARKFNVSLAGVFRRLSVLSDDILPRPMGLVMCDGSGTLMLRKPIEGFPVPRFSAACPKWPLFQALNRPLHPIRQTVTVTGRDALQFECYAVTEPVGQVTFNEDPLYHSYMLVVPVESGDTQGREVGSSCRVCPSAECLGRREPSILVDGI